jgi:hypothetical protein
MIIPVNWANWIVQYNFEGDAEPMITTMGVNVSTWGGDYSEGLEWLSDLWFACFASSLAETVLMGPYSLAVGQDGGDPVSYTYDVQSPGDESSFPMWPNTALLVKKQSASGGRRNRGRCYVPGLGLRTLVTPAGIIDPSYLADLQTNLDNMLGIINAGSGFNATNLGVLHSEPPGAPAVITALTAANKVATQRRRLRP